MLLSEELWIEAFEKMLLIRRFEEKCAQFYGMGKISGFCHLYIGQEAVAVSAYLSKSSQDTMITAYRDHGHALVCGMDPGIVLAELMGKVTGSSKGKGGSMHIFDIDKGFYGGHGIVGACVSLGTGIAFAHKYKQDGGMSYTFFGDGAANQGQTFESFNMAKLWNLPVLYIIENNGYAMGTSVERSTGMTDLYKRGESLGIEGMRVDGMKIDVLYEAFCELSHKVRNDNCPYLLEAETYRYKGHSMSDPGFYRSKEEVAQYKESDPIAYAKEKILEMGIKTESQLKEIEKSIKDRIKAAVDFAENSEFPNILNLREDVFTKKIC
ncbi:pyruvate dehydrogenase (acetyl-transferring) E1 component subunit alpha [Candidatus Sneabacter namystus]|uniref:Pyruvate dehydrogenase E1 component subunit alpha n=1 Tax=Candidatus Sneabacter namystus TaxID=2601646 RepID=A0A5C0UJH5_9RICK|nr:pyruvate dehydrogenase (acetyl-transferring) E1 component subunit alpha [Candidatus Sneabacter namystus]QEK39622.1 pyruvate dehydrogenase (acetyl-transferring) E1 component subunit alpha [Candidatus Sneabacter namystus]